MKTFELHKVRRSVAIFCHQVKVGGNCTSSKLDCTNKMFKVLTTVLTHKFSVKNGDPIDFPKLFICDDEKKGLYHKNTTPNDIELQDLNTIVCILRLMTYVSRQLNCAKKEKNKTIESYSFELSKIKKVVYDNGFIHIFFR